MGLDYCTKYYVGGNNLYLDSQYEFNNLQDSINMALKAPLGVRCSVTNKGSVVFIRREDGLVVSKENFVGSASYNKLVALLSDYRSLLWDRFIPRNAVYRDKVTLTIESVEDLDNVLESNILVSVVSNNFKVTLKFYNTDLGKGFVLVSEGFQTSKQLDEFVSSTSKLLYSISSLSCVIGYIRVSDLRRSISCIERVHVTADGLYLVV